MMRFVFALSSSAGQRSGLVSGTHLRAFGVEVCCVEIGLFIYLLQKGPTSASQKRALFLDC